MVQRWHPDMDFAVEEMPVAAKPSASPCARPLARRRAGSQSA
jgi:hypothetical protein